MDESRQPEANYDTVGTERDREGGVSLWLWFSGLVAWSDNGVQTKARDGDYCGNSNTVEEALKLTRERRRRKVGSR